MMFTFNQNILKGGRPQIINQIKEETEDWSSSLKITLVKKSLLKKRVISSEYTNQYNRIILNLKQHNMSIQPEWTIEDRITT
jgi:hypothetical protein